ncbi:iron ABC transporter permease [Waterburya agarophytonicola K14]|uniref:Iron ABC transporter permease n=1 Tax=Waterburya agarophytonicola KI4 TaxID=2874699 RepID=A0A964BV64_9CYAN|nr:iron ABC transporter permease [Waterburya agarophytonicola]MCC0178726.1 iron ABC transporter permease [Waterburya agarophytonicola KI4]
MTDFISSSAIKTIKRLSLNGWTLMVMAIALIIATPIFFVFSSIFAKKGDIWQHLAATVLQDYIINSFLLMFLVGIGVCAIGVGTAWLVTMCRFWGSRCLEWALLLPLAAPAYLLAYAYTNMLDYFGPVQSALRNIFGWTTIQDYWFPDIRSLWGAAVMLLLVLYPYVYLLARVAFLEQSVCTIEASRSLGCNPWRSFFTIALPLARPSIVAGLALALMETLNDLGTVEYFGINTFTTGIYRTWLGMGERSAAAQLAAFLMLFILILIVLERRSRRAAQYYEASSSIKRLTPFELKSWRGILALVACMFPVTLGFIIPGGYLLQLTLKNLDSVFDGDFLDLAQHSFILASITAIVAMTLSLFMAYGQRLESNWLMKTAVRIAAMGYAIPGSVIAVGVLIPVAGLDNIIDRWMQATFNISTGLLLSGTVASLIFAYLVRFLAVAFGSVESSLNKISPNLDDASRSLGYGSTSTLWKIHTPLMAGGLLTSAMLVFVDVMKELPATLVIRPFNFDTLGIRVYQYASDERLAEAAAPALAIVLVGIIPVILLSWRITHSR